MYASALSRRRITPSASVAPAVAGLFVDERDCDMPGVSLPRPRIHLVVRFGPSTRSGLDVHAMGMRQTVHRKFIHSGQRTIAARLHLNTPEAVLGAPAAAIAGRIVPLEDLWGEASASRLCQRLADAHDTADAAAVLQRAIAERLVSAGTPSMRAELALRAAASLSRSNHVNAVAAALGVSERHLRRTFHDAFGISPKTFAKLARFRRALRAARAESPANWAGLALDSGYYDQAHLITEFRAIANTTPSALLDELRTALSIG